MAHQIKSGITVQSGPRHVLKRPALAALLGSIAAEWGSLEDRITFFYAYLMGRYLPRTPGFSPPIHPVALQVFDVLETLRKRLELIESLGAWVIKNDALVQELRDTVMPAILRASKLRNEYLHAHWGVADEYPDALILLPIFGNNMACEESDFNEAINRIIAATDIVGKFEVKVREFLDGK